MISLFWSFTNSTTRKDVQKKTYGFLVAVAQVGSIMGPTVVRMKAESWGIAAVYGVGAGFIVLMVATVAIYISMYGYEPAEGGGKKKKSTTGVLEGLKLFNAHNYVKGIFAISCLFMIEVTIVDYTMKVLAKEYFEEQHPCHEDEACWPEGMSDSAAEGFAGFMGAFGQATNTLR